MHGIDCHLILIGKLPVVVIWQRDDLCCSCNLEEIPLEGTAEVNVVVAGSCCAVTTTSTGEGEADAL